MMILMLLFRKKSKILINIVTLCGHCVGCVCVRASQTISLSVLARNPHKGPRTSSPARPEVERNIPEKTQGQLTKEDRERQSTTEARWRTVSRRRQWRKTVKNELAFQVSFVEVSRKIHVCDSLQMHGKCKVSQNTLSCTWSWSKSMLFVCSSFHPCGCILCGRCEM